MVTRFPVNPIHVRAPEGSCWERVTMCHLSPEMEAKKASRNKPFPSTFSLRVLRYRFDIETVEFIVPRARFPLSGQAWPGFRSVRAQVTYAGGAIARARHR